MTACKHRKSTQQPQQSATEHDILCQAPILEDKCPLNRAFSSSLPALNFAAGPSSFCRLSLVPMRLFPEDKMLRMWQLM